MDTTLTLDPARPGFTSLLSDPAYTPGGIASRTLLQAPGVRVVWMGLDAGQELTEHTTPKRVLVQILEGTCEFQLGPDWQRLGPGDLVHLTPGLPHAVRALNRLAFLLILIPSSMPAPAASGLSLVPDNASTSSPSLTAEGMT